MAKTVQEQIAALETRIKADRSKLAELQAQEKAAAALASLKQGDVIEFLYGRGETRAQYTGVVRIAFDTDKGPRVKVLAGEGVDEELFVIEPSAIVAVGEDVQEAGAQAENVAAAKDPLADIE